MVQCADTKIIHSIPTLSKVAKIYNYEGWSAIKPKNFHLNPTFHISMNS